MTVPFGELFEFVRNGMNVKQDKSGSGLPITRIETISDGTVDGSRVGFAGLGATQCAKWLLKPGDILFSHINSVEQVGKCAVYRGVPGQLVHGMNLLCLRPRPDVLDSEFAKYMIRSREFRSRLSAFVNKAVNQASVSVSNLKSIPVHVPLVADQRRIAEILDRAEALRAKRRAALRELHVLQQAAFTDLFGDPGSNSKGWRLGRVSDYVSAFQGGKSFEADVGEDAATSYRVLKISAVTSTTFRAEESKPVPADYVPQPGHLLRDGDLLFSRANTTELVGAVAYVENAPPNLLLPDKLWRFVWRDPGCVDPLFVWALFQTSAVRREIARRATGTSGSMKNISQEKLLGIPLIIPPVEKQREFAARQRAIEGLKQLYRMSCAELDALAASLEHRAFRGEL